MGGCRCCFRSCESRTHTHPDTHYFHFPWRQRPRCEQWARNSGHPEFMNLPDNQLRNKVVCQQHFREACFMNYLHASLTKFAVPTFERIGGDTSGYILDYEHDADHPVRETLTGERIVATNDDDNDEEGGEIVDEQTKAAEEVDEQLKEDYIVEYVDEGVSDGGGEAILQNLQMIDDELLPMETAEIITNDLIEQAIYTGETIETPADAKFITKADFNIITSDVAAAATNNAPIISSSRPPPKILNGLKTTSITQMAADIGTFKKLTRIVLKKRSAPNSTLPRKPKIPRVDADEEAPATHTPPNNSATDVPPPSSDDGRIKTLLDELQSVRGELDAKNDEIGQLQRKLVDSTLRVERLSKDASDSDALEQQLNGLQQKFAAQAKKLKQSEDQVKRMGDLQKIIDSQASQLADEQTENAKKNNELRQKIVQQSEQISSLEDKIAALQADLDRAEANQAAADEIPDRKPHLELLQQTNDDQQRRLELQSLQIADLRKQIQALRTEAAANIAPATAAPAAPAAAAGGCNKTKAKPEKIVPLSKPQLFNGIRRYLNPSMISLLRMEMFADAEREYKPDERQIAMELWALPAASDAHGSNSGLAAGSVYEYMRSEWRFRLPPKSDVLQWISDRDENAGDEEEWDDC